MMSVLLSVHGTLYLVRRAPFFVPTCPFIPHGRDNCCLHLRSVFSSPGSSQPTKVQAMCSTTRRRPGLLVASPHLPNPHYFGCYYGGSPHVITDPLAKPRSVISVAKDPYERSGDDYPHPAKLTRERAILSFISGTSSQSAMKVHLPIIYVFLPCLVFLGAAVS
ncbi:hypothetical protein H4582DRAFT_1956920 [Lactarius indigo]|nr:hypothetical protein H4582DRAFT_1956920 [Lactarius indigo]